MWLLVLIDNIQYGSVSNDWMILQFRAIFRPSTYKIPEIHYTIKYITMSSFKAETFIKGLDWVKYVIKHEWCKIVWSEVIDHTALHWKVRNYESLFFAFVLNNYYK